MILLSLFIAGCGHKGPVRPLLKPLPAEPEEVRVRQLGETVQLSWQIPQENQDGTSLTDLAGFNVYRVDFDPAGECPECREITDLLLRLDLAYLEQARRVGERIYLRDEQVSLALGYRYRITPVTEKGRDGASAETALVLYPPPPAPEQLSAQGQDRMVRLQWQAGAEERQGVEPLGYFIYRRTADALFSPLPLNSTPVDQPVYEDYEVENGIRYEYAVRSVIRIDGRSVQGPLSPVAEAEPQSGR